MLAAVNLGQKLTTFTEYFQPRTVATFNDADIMVAKVSGPFEWHKHEDTDDFFLVLHGRLRLETEDGHVTLGPGELAVIPRGVMHRPVAEEECHIMLIERTGTPNTGDPATAAPRRVV